MPEGESIILVFILLVLGVGIFLARKNFLRGRGDLRGALRLGGYVFTVYLVVWALRVKHVASFDELLMIRWAVGMSLFLGVIVWILYLALEPYVRRLWPGTLVSWSRFLSGRLQDPLVGRDILIGGLVGAWIVFVILSSLLLQQWMDGSTKLPVVGSVDVLTNARHALSLLFSVQTSAVVNPLGIMLLLMILRVVLRKEWLAVGGVLLVFALVNSLSSLYTFSWIQVISALLVWIPAILVLTRFGILSSFMMFYFANLVFSLPLTTDFTHWYAGRVTFLFVLLVAIVIYGFYASLAGRPILSDEMFLDEEAV